MQLPLRAEEILAGRDLLRAEFAVELRLLEQKPKSLNAIMPPIWWNSDSGGVSLSRADLLALSRQGSERGGEVAALHRALAETSAELAATAKESTTRADLLSARTPKSMSSRRRCGKRMR